MTAAGQNERRTTFESTNLESAGERPAWLSAWRDSRTQSRGGSTGEMLDRYPELKFRKSVVLSMAYDEYCRREAAGEAVDRREFCRAFPGHQESVARLLSVYQYLKERDLLPNEAALEENWPEPGETIAGFHLLDGLGLGAFARVYIAEEPAVAHRRVAVKVSSEGAAEVDVLGKLSHPNIVQILSVRQDEERHWALISMPYLGQATLDDVIWQLFSAADKRPLAARQLLDVVEQINGVGIPPEPAEPDPLLAKRPYVDGVVHLLAQLADALAYTHAKGICHRDLKPSNVLFAAGGKPMLLDFNLAQDQQATGRRLGGTLPYMAPEQLNSIVLEPQAGPPSIDPRSDLFSLAVIGYELLCGVWPYGTIPAELTQDEFAIELFERQRSGPVPLKERNPQIGADVSALLQRCLSFDVDARPPTAAEMAAELRRCLSPLRRAKRWVRRRRKLVACAATAFLSLAAWAGYFVATLPPYGERQLSAALAALERRELPAAIGHLN
ncbi:MAG TPA: serine/threonine-protein kinase, partial [Pirellulales bacterium]|nr:serine/threonine-protein kinase [Pirellulales bacterium]